MPVKRRTTFATQTRRCHFDQAIDAQRRTA
jgi:hypothetical protein